jgi:hypothetical protein
MEYIRIVDGEDEMHVAEVLDIREDCRFKSISRIKQSVLLYRFLALENHIIKIPFGSNWDFFIIINFFSYHRSDISKIYG